jgi:hypothetical protein
VIGCPFVDGADQDTVTLPFPRTAVGFPGADGVPTTSDVEAVEAGDVPLAFVALTVNV